LLVSVAPESLLGELKLLTAVEVEPQPAQVL
jgi:hypothetical protein